MIWRDHKRLAADMARAFGLEEFRDALVEGSVEPDKKRTLVHTWPRARRYTRSAMYRARKAFLTGKMKRCARFLGIVSHFIADGMVHETIDTYHQTKEHSRIENELGDLVEISNFPVIDSFGEGMVDGEFVFREIDALVKEGLDSGRLGRSLSLLGSAVLSPPEAPRELIEGRREFIERIRKPVFKFLGIFSIPAALSGAALFRDPVWALLLPFCLLCPGRPVFFRFLARYGWLFAAGAGAAAAFRFDWSRLLLTALLAGIQVYLAAVPDLTRQSERWYRLEDEN